MGFQLGPVNKMNPFVPAMITLQALTLVFLLIAGAGCPPCVCWQDSVAGSEFYRPSAGHDNPYGQDHDVVQPFDNGTEFATREEWPLRRSRIKDY